MDKISEHIAHLVSKKDNALHHYRNGACFDFYLLLKKKFPEAQAWYDGNHVVTLIQGRFWDVGGLAMYPLESEPRIFKGAHTWSDPCTSDMIGQTCSCSRCNKPA